jgi:hypothetical protein
MSDFSTVFCEKPAGKSASGRNTPTRIRILAYVTKIVKNFLQKISARKTAGGQDRRHPAAF